jgi:hypothetical protein
MINSDKIEISAGTMRVEVDTWFEALRVVEWMCDKNLLGQILDFSDTNMIDMEEEQ